MTPRLKAANTQEGFPSENTYDHNNSSDHTNNNTVHKTLLEIHRISDHEIEKRKELLYFTDNDRDILESMRSKIELNVDKIVSDFYKQQVQFPEITLIIGDAETMQRLQISMRSYIMDICSGFYDAEYVNRRLRIGKVHQRIGLPPKLYVSSLCLMRTTITKYMLDRSDPEYFEKASALDKLIMFDMQLVFDTYISSLVDEVQVAKDTLETYAKSLEEKVSSRTAQLKELSVRDRLTNLYNRRGLYEILRHELAVAKRSLHPVSLIYMDLNNFKKLNDHSGHDAGDTILQMVGAAIESGIRDIDHGFRHGGDEFSILLPNTLVDAAKQVYMRIIREFDKGDTMGVTFSAGIIQSDPAIPPERADLLKKADALMYEAKTLAHKDNQHHIETGVC